MQSDWIKNDLVFARMRLAQKGNTSDLISWVGDSGRRVASDSGEFVALIRTHAAWQYDGLWYDRNGPPEPGELGREFLNLFSWQCEDDCGMWLKLPLPQNLDEFRIRNAGEKFVLSWRDKRLAKHQVPATGRNLLVFMLGQLSGSGHGEAEIQAAFKRLTKLRA